MAQNFFGDAIEELGLNKQEQFLYEMHLNNLWGPGGVTNKDGSRSTLFQMPVQHQGKWYNIPTVWNGKKVDKDTAKKNVGNVGWENFPSYNSAEDADARYQQMHKFMEMDTADWFDSQQPMQTIMTGQ